MSVPKLSDLRTWDGTQFTNDDYDYNSETIVNWLANGNADLVVNSVTANNGLDVQDARITSVAPATSGTDAVNLDQVTSLLTTSNPYQPFSIASGKVNATGYAAYLQKDSDTQLTILAGNTNPDLVVVQSDGTIETLTDDVVLTISVSDGTYTIVKEKGEAPVLTSGTVSEGIVFPSAPSDGDYFLLTSVKPYAGYKYASVGGWGAQEFVKMGVATVSSGTATLKTYNYNQCNFGQELIQGIPITVVSAYNNGTSWYRIYSDGWIEQGGYGANSATSISLVLSFKNTNYSILSGNSGTSLPKNPTLWHDKTVSSFGVVTDPAASGFDWEAKGY